MQCVHSTVRTVRACCWRRKTISKFCISYIMTHTACTPTTVRGLFNTATS